MEIQAGSQGGIERRRQHRFECYWPAACWYGDGRSDPVVVIDASTGGFCIASKVAVEVGQMITLELDSIGKFECEVRWTAADRFGVLIQREAQELTVSDVESLADSLDLVKSTV